MNDSDQKDVDTAQTPRVGARTGKAYDRWDLILAIGFVVALGLGAIELKNFAGLPAHPAFLHFPIVLIPCLAIAAIVFAVKPNWRRRYGVAYGLGAIVTLACTGLTVSAGEAYKEKEAAEEGTGAVSAALEHHAELGNATRIAVIGLVVVILVQVAIDRGVVPALSRHFEKAKAPLAITLSALTIVLAGVSAAYVVETGHAGAKLTFGDESSEPAATGGEAGGAGEKEPGAAGAETGEPGATEPNATEPGAKESGGEGAEAGK